MLPRLDLKASWEIPLQQTRLETDTEVEFEQIYVRIYKSILQHQTFHEQRKSVK